MDQGWVKLHRKMMDWPWFTDGNTLKLWVYCLLRANYKAKVVPIGGQEQQIEPGQFIFGRVKAAKATKMSQRNVRTALAHLLTAKCVKSTTHPTNQCSILTIVNWEHYQSPEDETDQLSDQPPTSHRPAIDHKQDVKEREEERRATSCASSLGDEVPKKPKRTRKPSGNGVVIPDTLNVPEFLNAWAAWQQHRREIGKSLKPSTTKKQLTALAKAGPVVAAMAIDASITNGWTGLFPERVRAGPSWTPPADREATAEEHAKGF